MKPISGKQKIIAALQRTGEPLTVDVLVQETGLTKSQVRNVVSTKFDTPIVYIGEKGYDLIDRRLKDTTFHYVLSAVEAADTTLRNQTICSP